MFSQFRIQSVLFLQLLPFGFHQLEPASPLAPLAEFIH
jgi:hypothetical protein